MAGITRRSQARPTADDSVPQVPQSTPMAQGFGGHDFTLQAVMELQKSVGEMNAKLDSLKSSVDSTKTKVDELMGLKNKVIGGAVVLGAVVSALTFVVSKASEYVTIKTPTSSAVQTPAPAPAPPAITPPTK